ncbi:MAG: PQQ-binding-like beta-propeller repeat protein [Verrucomicrobiales bacterium]|nr:PQQ-binding-like beta-propeller repeat protein [Verrucomicrobiales bacterium]
MRWWMAALIVAAVGGVWVWCEFTEFVFRGYLELASSVVGGLLLGLWYVFFTGLPWRRRIGLFFGGVLVLGVLVACGVTFLRVEGSVDGGSLPRLVWKDAPKPGEGIDALEVGGEVEVTSGSESWPGYLGPSRDGIAEGGWELGAPELHWRREIGLGWSGFVVKNGLAITQEQRGEEELVSAYALETGEPVWVHGDEARFSEHFGGDGPRATPTISGGRVYAQGATGILNCLELGSGEIVWSTDIFEYCEGGNQEWGKSNSPLVVGESVIVTGGTNGPGLLCFSATDGALKWTAGDGVSPSYSSPMLAELGGVEQIVVVNEQLVTGHATGDGSKLWEYSWPKKFPKVAQPQRLGEGRLLLTTGYGADSFLIQITRAGDEWVVDEEWRSNRMKTKFSSAIVHGGFAYGLDEGRFSCIDLANGKRL